MRTALALILLTCFSQAVTAANGEITFNGTYRFAGKMAVTSSWREQTLHLKTDADRQRLKALIAAGWQCRQIGSQALCKKWEELSLTPEQMSRLTEKYNGLQITFFPPRSAPEPAYEGVNYREFWYFQDTDFRGASHDRFMLYESPAVTKITFYDDQGGVADGLVVLPDGDLEYGVRDQVRISPEQDQVFVIALTLAHQASL